MRYAFLLIVHSVNCCKGVHFVVLWRNWHVNITPVSLRGTLRFEIVTWPHTVRGVRNSWCGGRASLFWVRGTTGVELIQDNKHQCNCFLLFLTSVMLIIQNHYFVVELDAIKYERVLCFLLHYSVSLWIWLRGTSVVGRKFSKEARMTLRIVTTGLFTVYMLFSWFQ